MQNYLGKHKGKAQMVLFSQLVCFVAWNILKGGGKKLSGIEASKIKSIHNEEFHNKAFILQGIFIFSLVTYKPVTYSKNYEYPGWAILIGWCMALSSMLCVPIYFFYQLAVTPGTLRQVLYIYWRIFTISILFK